MKLLLVFGLVMVLAASAYGLDKKAFQMREDYGTEPLYDCYMNYYYYIPCPTYAWFWAYTGVSVHDIIGVFFTVGDPSMGQSECAPDFFSCDPHIDQTIEQFRILDYAGYGTIYPGLWTVVFDIWCSDAQGCPVGPSLWNSGPVEFCNVRWNYISVNPNVSVTSCCTQPTSSYPRFLITATAVGSSSGAYPAWGFDNISSPLERGCAMHDQGCCPAFYPRPAVSHYSTIHSGFYGTDFAYCPPIWFVDGRDTTGGDVYGFIELAWRVYLLSTGPDAAEPCTWGTIKSMYR